MSNFQCPECGMINIDCGWGNYKTPREIELEKENEILKEKLKIAEEYINFMASGNCTAEICEYNKRKFEKCLKCVEVKAEEALQKIKEVK